MNKYVKLCDSIADYLGSHSAEDMLETYFSYPGRKDYLEIVCASMCATVLKNDVSERMMQVCSMLIKALKTPEALTVESSGYNKQQLIDMLIVDKLNYRTTSVEYINGVLQYCVKPINNVLGKEFYIDRHTLFDDSMALFTKILKSNTDEKTISMLKDRVKILKRLTKELPNVDKGIALCKVQRKYERIRLTITEDNTNQCNIINIM